MRKFATLLIALMVLLSFCYSANAEEFTLRNGIAFGDSMEDVKSKETIAIDKIDDEFGEKDEGKDYPYSIKTKDDTVAGVSGASIRYKFDKDKKLREVSYEFPASSSRDINDNTYEKINNGLTRKYGSPLGYSNGTTYIVTGSALSSAYLSVELIKMMDGIGDVRDYDEWVVNCDDYNVKIELINYYFGSSYSDVTYDTDLSYTYFTDEKLEEEQRNKREQQEAVDNDI